MRKVRAKEKAIERLAPSQARQWHLGEPWERLVTDKPLAIPAGDVLGGTRSYALVEVLVVASSDEYPDSDPHILV
jgi:hypothetical protein